MNDPDNDDRRGELTLDSDGRLLYDLERRALEYAVQTTLRGAGTAAVLAGATVEAIDTLGRLRARGLHQFVKADENAPLDELRDRIRVGIERQTVRILNEDDRLRPETTHTLKDLVSAYIGLGGPLELEPTVTGTQHAATAAELAHMHATNLALADAVDQVLDQVRALPGGMLAEGRLEDLGNAIERLGEVR